MTCLFIMILVYIQVIPEYVHSDALPRQQWVYKQYIMTVYLAMSFHEWKTLSSEFGEDNWGRQPYEHQVPKGRALLSRSSTPISSLLNLSLHLLLFLCYFQESSVFLTVSYPLFPASANWPLGFFLLTGDAYKIFSLHLSLLRYFIQQYMEQN